MRQGEGFVLKDYDHHIFISYPRGGDAAEWLHNHLCPVLKNQLDNEMPEEPRIFVDESIDKGSEWTMVLERALHRSCCLLTVWTPQFFRSKWCLAEWETMRLREQRLGLRTADKPNGLVYPLVFADGNCFPQEAKRIQSRLDLHDYAYPYLQFKTTAKYLDFHDKVRQVARELVKMLAYAPAWDPEWESCKPEPNEPLSIPFRRL